MANLGNVVYLSETQKEELFSTGKVDGTDVTYSDNDLYVTPKVEGGSDYDTVIVDEFFEDVVLINQDFEELKNIKNFRLWIEIYKDVATNTQNIIYLSLLGFNQVFYSMSVIHNASNKYIVISSDFSIFKNNDKFDIQISDAKHIQTNKNLMGKGDALSCQASTNFSSRSVVPVTIDELNTHIKMSFTQSCNVRLVIVKQG